MSERIDELQLRYAAKEQECERLQNDLDIVRDAYNNERRALNEEIDSIKERESSLKN